MALLQVATNAPTGVMEQLRQDEKGLLQTVKLLLPDHNREVLLVIDQFEELFNPEIDEADRTHFLANLVTAVSTPNSNIHIIITLQASFYDKPLHYSAFSTLLRDHTQVVIPMTTEEITEAITEPAKGVGVTIEPPLIGAITADIADQPTALPLLQYALTELFEQRNGRFMTLATYKAIGGITGALTRRAESLYQRMDKGEQQRIHQIFLRLITLGEGVADTRRRVFLAELESITTNKVEPELSGRWIIARRLPLSDNRICQTPSAHI